MPDSLKQLFSFEKLILIIAVGLPGASKVLFALVIKHETDLIELGLYANDLNIALILSAITGIGFSVVLMNRLPRIKNALERRGLMGRITVIATLFSVFAGLGAYPLKYFGLVESPGSILLFLLGYSNYIVYRHYLMALQQYLSVLKLEFITLVLIGGALVIFSDRINPLLIHASLLLIVFGLVNWRQGKYNLKRMFVLSEIKSGFGFGMSNLSSSFLALISVPLAKQLLGTVYAGFLGLINPLIQISVLVPRSLSNYYLPEMAKEVKYSLGQKRIYKKFHRINSSFLAFVVLSFAVLWFFYEMLFPESEMILEYSHYVLLLLLLNLFFSQLNLSGFNLLGAWDYSGLSFKINLAALVFFLLFASVVALLKYDGFKGFLIIHILMILMNIGRWEYLRHLIGRKFKAN